MYNNDSILGINGIPAENLPAGVGFVIIPKNVDVEQYKEDVYRSGRISIYGGYGHSNFYNILIDRETLQRIKFPKNSEEKGSPVVWINIPKHNEPIIIACLKYDEDFHSLSENRKRDTKGEDGTMVDWDLDGKNAKVKLVIKGNEKSNGEFEININSKTNDSRFKILVNGEILQKSYGKTIRISQHSIVDAVTDLSGIVKARIKLDADKNAENILEYGDTYKNKISANSEKLEVSKENSIFSISDEGFKIQNEQESIKLILNDMLKMYMKTKTIDGKPLDPSCMNDAVSLLKRVNNLFD